MNETTTKRITLPAMQRRRKPTKYGSSNKLIEILAIKMHDV